MGQSLRRGNTLLSGETLRNVIHALDSLSCGLLDQSLSVISSELKDTVGT